MLGIGQQLLNGCIADRALLGSLPRYQGFRGDCDEALRLAERCRHLEALEVPVNSRNAVWDWELCASASAEESGRVGAERA